MNHWPWWVRLALWVAGVVVEDEKPAPPLLPPPLSPAAVVPPPGRAELAHQLMATDQVMHHAFRGTPWKAPDPRWRS